MLDHLHRTRYTSRQCERGQALLLLLVLVGLAAGIFVFSNAGNVSTYVSPTAERVDRDALAQAKAALILYVTITNFNTTRPGAFPCPDFDDGTANPLNTANDGVADLYAGNECPGYVANSNVYLGRLPWKTLGLPDLRDSSGERLWYAVSRDFATNPTCLPNCPDLTSDTLGLTVNGKAAAAILFAPGRALGSQVRDAANANTASNYLEGENADGNNATFAAAIASSTFNDRLLTITNPDFMPEVEKYVAQQMITILTQYKAATNVYPWADLSDGDSNASGFNYYNHWRFPCGTALPWNWGRINPGNPPITPVLPPWLKNGCGSPVTGWVSVIYYAVSRNRLENSGSNCTTCGGSQLQVDGNNVGLVLITPGGYTGSPTRSWSDSNFTTITGYFEDSSNTNNNDTFVTPTAKTYNRDRIYTLP